MIERTSTRTASEIREHYEIEKELAERLRQASKAERGKLYSEVYDELYRRIPKHPQLIRKTTETEKIKAVERQMKFLRQFMGEDFVYLEIGPGDCSLSFEVCNIGKKVYAVDVSEEITKGTNFPDNFKLVLSDGSSIPLPEESVDLAYSNQLMEHLHPDDALDQLWNIYTALVQSGKYICQTPNRISGPHDISSYYDQSATGLHLKEYTIGELAKLFRKVGFSKVCHYFRFKTRYVRVWILPLVVYEKALLLLPNELRQRLLQLRFFRLLLGIRIVGIK